MENIFFFFFFSSRRRHTRLTCDWSSDVCSADLVGACSGAQPLFCASPATFTCNNTRCGVVDLRSSSRASSRESSECTRSNRPATTRALLRCRCPIRCQRIPSPSPPAPNSSCFCSASCTRFSPMSASPASRAARTASVPNPLVTATIVTGCGASRAISALTCAKRSGRASKAIAFQYKGDGHLAAKEALNSLRFHAVDDVGERLARIQMVGTAEVVQGVALVASHRRGIPELQKRRRKGRRDLLRRRLELE